MIKKIVTIAIVFVFCSLFTPAQESDYDLILKKENKNPALRKRLVTFGITQSENVLVKYNPVSLFFGSLLFVYQKALSPQISAGCYFKPSCSAYSKKLIKEYGIFKGIMATSDRLMRCNRIAIRDVLWKQDDHDHHVHESVDYYQFREKQKPSETE